MLHLTVLLRQGRSSVASRLCSKFRFSTANPPEQALAHSAGCPLTRGCMGHSELWRRAVNAMDWRSPGFIGADLRMLTRPAKVHINYLMFEHVRFPSHQKVSSTRLFSPPPLALHCCRITPRLISLKLTVPYFPPSDIGAIQLIGLFSHPDREQTRARAKERIPPERLKPTTLQLLQLCSSFSRLPTLRAYSVDPTRGSSSPTKRAAAKLR